jgi:outer membrane protein
MKKLLTLVFGILFLSLNAQQKWSLQECVDYALKNNLQVQQNEYNKQIQDKNLEIAKKQILPSVSASINNTMNFGQGQDVFGNMKRNDNFNNNANIGANILLYNNGRLEKTVRKTKFDVEASQYDLETIQNNISLQIVQQYLSVLLNKEIEKINESAFENAKEMYNRAKITTEAGSTPQTVLAEAEATMAREKQNLENAEINIGRSLFTLAQLLLLPEYKNFDVEDVLISDAMMAQYSDSENVLAKALENQPQIKAAESRINSAKAQTEITKTNFFPTISATAGVGTFYFNSLVTNTVGYDINGNPIKESQFFKQYKDNFGQQVGVSANIPIFNKGITKLQVEQSKINEEITKNALEQAKLDLKQNVQKAQFDAESNFEIYTAALETEKSSNLALDYARKSFDAGKTTIYDLNIAVNNFVNAQSSVAQAKYNYLFSLKLLDFYAGIPLAF